MVIFGSLLIFQYEKSFEEAKAKIGKVLSFTIYSEDRKSSCPLAPVMVIILK